MGTAKKKMGVKEATKEPWVIVWKHPPKPWDRGKAPLWQETMTPAGYTDKQAEAWFYANMVSLHIPKGATIIEVKRGSHGIR